MGFISVEYPIFLVCSACLYFIAPKKSRYIVLLLSSLVFYAWNDWRYIFFMLPTALVCFLAALFISKQNDTLKKRLSEASDSSEKSILRTAFQKKNTAVLIAAIAFMLGLWIISKFHHRILALAGAILRAEESLSFESAFSVLGISYYTFCAIGYLLDVYWKHYSAERNPLKLLLFLIFFPHILQGPFARYNHLGKQLYEGHDFDYKRISFALQLMLWGYFQKLVIADRFAIFVDTIFSNWQDYQGFMLLAAMAFCAIKMYTDFAGCMCIAGGTAEIFGIHLEENFHQPYFACSVADFWRRWHITLGNWFKDYLCMPIVMSNPMKKLSKKVTKKWGRSAGKNCSMVFALAAVWICTGLWHGTGWNYVIWGVSQGLIIIFSMLMEPLYSKWKAALRIDETRADWKAFCMARTFLICGMFTKPFTQLARVSDAMGFFKNIFSSFNPWIFFDGSLYECGLSEKSFKAGLVAVCLLIGVSIARERGVAIRERIAEFRLPVRWGIYYAAFFAVAVYGIYGPGFDASSFVYIAF